MDEEEGGCQMTEKYHDDPVWYDRFDLNLSYLLARIFILRLKKFATVIGNRNGKPAILLLKL